MFECGQGISGFTTLGDGDHQRFGVGHAVAVAVFAGNLNLAGNFGNGLQPVLGHAAAVVAGAASQYQHAVDGLKYVVSALTGTVIRDAVKQLRRDGNHAFQRVANGTWLLENFFLHVVTIRPQLSCATVGMHGLDHALHRLACLVDHPIFAQLHIDHVALFHIEDLVGHARQGHGVAGQKILAVGEVCAHTQDQRGTGARANHAVWLVFVNHSQRIGTMQAFEGGQHGF